MDTTKALKEAVKVHSMYSSLEGTCISLYDGSDFINLTKLTALMVQKERERNAKIESQQKPTFGRWIWKTWKNLGELMYYSDAIKTNVLGDDGEGTIEITHRRRIFGPLTSYDYLLGYEGFEVEYTWAKSTVAEVVKNLSEEEWDCVEMKIKEVEALKFRDPVYWDPKEDPRPDWRIQEIQNLNQMKNTVQKTVAHGSRLACSESGQNQKTVQETVVHGSRLACNESGQNQKTVQETVAHGSWV